MKYLLISTAAREVRIRSSGRKVSHQGKDGCFSVRSLVLKAVASVYVGAPHY